MDFEENIDLRNYSIKCKVEKDSLQEIVNKIIVFNKENISIDDIKNVYKKVFEEYYSDDKYIKLIRERLMTLKN